MLSGKKQEGKVIAFEYHEPTEIIPREKNHSIYNTAHSTVLSTMTSTCEILSPETFYPILLPMGSPFNTKLPLDLDLWP